MDQPVNKVKFTYLIPVFNGSHTLKACLNSIEQRHDIEILVIDDGSDENENNLIKDICGSICNAHLITLKENCGISNALNVGIKNARGEYILRLDADDTDLPGRISAQYSELERRKLDFIGGFALVHDENGDRVYRLLRRPRKFLSTYSKFASPIIHPTLMIKTCVLARYGYEASYSGIEDYHLFRRLLGEGYKGGNLRSPVISYCIPSYRVFPNNYRSDMLEALLTGRRFKTRLGKLFFHRSRALIAKLLLGVDGLVN